MNPSNRRHSPFIALSIPAALLLWTAAVLTGADGLGPWEEVEMRVCLSQFVKYQKAVIPVLLLGSPARPNLPLFLTEFTWVDLREGFTDRGLDRLEWAITGKKPAPR